MAESIYIKLEGKWIEVPKNECIAESLGFTRQACHYGMGMYVSHSSSQIISIILLFSYDFFSF